MGNLEGKNIAILATDAFEDVELTSPRQALLDAGANVEIISDHSGSIEGKNGTKVEVDKRLEDSVNSDYDGLLLPGGVGNPDVMRQNESAVAFVASFFDDDQPVAAICHAPWMLIEANVVKGRNITSWPSLKTDLINAGATWHDEAVVQDGKLITSRNPDDLPAFNKNAIELFTKN